MFSIEANSDTLSAPLQNIAGTITTRHTLPVLGNVLLEKNKSKLSWTSTDIEIQIQSHIALDGQEDGEGGRTTVPMRKLQDYLNSLSQTTRVRLECHPDKVNIFCGKRVRGTLAALPADNFPLMTFNDPPVWQTTLTQRDLRQLLYSVGYAMAQQDTRYYMNGALLSRVGQELRAVGTDGHRMAYRRYPLLEQGQEGEKVEAILPRKVVQELLRLLNDENQPVELRIARSQMQFLFRNIEIISKLVDGNYPDYEAVIPKTSLQIRMERISLLEALQRATIMANEKLRAVRLLLKPHQLMVMGTNTSHEQSEEELPVEYEGPELDIGFNASYLIDFLSHARKAHVWMRCNQDEKDSVVFAEDGDESFQYVVKPMRI